MAADLVIAEAVAAEQLAIALSPLTLSEPRDDPSPLSAYLAGRRFWRGRNTRLSAGVVRFSMMVLLYVAGPTEGSKKLLGTGSASSGNDCLTVGERSSTAARPRSMSSRVSSTRRR